MTHLAGLFGIAIAIKTRSFFLRLEKGYGIFPDSERIIRKVYKYS